MENQSFLTLRVRALRYGISTAQVLEILKLPGLVAVANMPDDIIGLLNYRGHALPVMHLARRLGQSNIQCQLSDSLVVLEWQGFQLGLVVEAVEEVYSLAAQDVEQNFSLGRDGHQISNSEAAFLSGIATIDDAMVMLLNPEALIREADAAADWAEALPELLEQSDAERSDSLSAGGGLAQQSLPVAMESRDGSPEQAVSAAPAPAAKPPGATFYERYCAFAGPEEHAIFRQRAEALKPSQTAGDAVQLSSVAVMRLGEDYFGLDLTEVREFIKVSNVTPVPCCPTHILGNMNLRGEVVTLVDIRGALRLPTEHSIALDKAIVVDVDDIVAGVTVEQVCDIVQLAPGDIDAVPAATASGAAGYFTGLASYQEHRLGILDFAKLVQAKNLVVDQSI